MNMNDVYKTIIYDFIRAFGWKQWSLGWLQLCYFMPLRKIAQLQSPWAHSFNQSLSQPYIFVNKPSIMVTSHDHALCSIIRWISDNILTHHDTRAEEITRVMTGAYDIDDAGVVGGLWCSPGDDCTSNSERNGLRNVIRKDEYWTLGINCWNKKYFLQNCISILTLKGTFSDSNNIFSWIRRYNRGVGGHMQKTRKNTVKSGKNAKYRLK